MGDVAPFVMELPAYHWPTVGNILRSMWERGWSFIKKAGTIILLSTIVIWFLSYFGWTDEGFGMLEKEQMDCSILAKLGWESFTVAKKPGEILRQHLQLLQAFRS